ncbi:hypothetical protein M9458_038595, partial [Cirrhinus mrigala]
MQVCFPKATVSQAILFSGTVEDFTQQFSAVQKQMEALKHILPWRDTPNTKSQRARSSSARCRGCPSVATTPAPPTQETSKE